MFKLIATIAYLSGLVSRIGYAAYRAGSWIDSKAVELSDTLADVKQRVVGACLSAAAETIRANNDKFKAVQLDQQRAALQAGEDLDHDIKLAYAAHSNSLKVIGQICDTQREKLNAKVKALRTKHTKLRSML